MRSQLLILFRILLYLMSHFSLGVFLILFLSLANSSLTMMCISLSLYYMAFIEILECVFCLVSDWWSIHLSLHQNFLSPSFSSVLLRFPLCVYRCPLWCLTRLGGTVNLFPHPLFFLFLRQDSFISPLFKNVVFPFCQIRFAGQLF